MADTDDVHRYGSRLANERDRLLEADMAEVDREAILSYFQYIDAQLDLSPATTVNRVKDVRLAAVRSEAALVEFDGTGDVDGLLFSLKHEYEIGEGGLRNYRKALRKFFEFLERPWATDIRVGSAPDRSVTDEDILGDEEVDAVLDVCSNARDKAMVAMMCDAGLRIGAVLSLRVRDVDLDATPPTVTINDNGPTKGASGTVLMTWSHAYVSNWLDIHPRRDEPSAALIHKLRGSVEDDGAITYQVAYRRIKDLLGDAGLDDDLSPHNLRKTAISQWIRDDLVEQEIKHRAHWGADSTQFDQYSGVTEAELNEKIAQKYGIVDDEGESVTYVDTCPRCTSSVRRTDRFCPSCSAALTQAAAEAEAEMNQAVSETLAELDAETATRLLDVIDEIDADPGLKRLLASIR